MTFKSISILLAKGLLVASMMGAGFAMAQAEPTLNQIYSTAQSGNLGQAQVMIQQVLVSHPDSGKAHFVQAELFARQGKMNLARESLANAERLAPGLPFAKPAAVQTLRDEVSGKQPALRNNGSAMGYAAPLAPAPSTSSWLLPLLLAGGVIGAGYFMFRRRAPVSSAGPVDYTNGTGLSGPQSFGIGSAIGQPAYPQGGYPQGAYPQAPYPQASGPGLGSRIAGGVATGLAVGAGVVAAEAIARSLTGNHGVSGMPMAGYGNEDVQRPNNLNADMGGNDFGVSDTGSWDDGGGFGVGGGDWNN